MAANEHIDPFLVDVDGVLATFCDSLFGRIGSEKKLADVLVWDFIAELPPAQLSHARSLLADYGFWSELGVVEGAKEGVARLRAIAPVVFVTSPYYSCRGWEHARREWLKEHFDAHPGKDVIVTGSKHLILGRTLIDDKPEHCEEWALRHGRPSVLFDAPYNQNCDHSRMLGWEDLDLILEERGW